MSNRTNELRDAIIAAMLDHVPENGWTMALARDVCDDMGIPADRLTAVFPGGLCDIVAHFSDRTDRLMMEQLNPIKTNQIRMRDRIELAINTRLDLLEGQHDALRLALAYWSVPPRHLRAGQIVWRTADRIWEWAGDTATDYNRYTKRALLSGILTSTILVWLKDESEDHQKTRAFLANRIENAMDFGQIISGLKAKKK